MVRSRHSGTLTGSVMYLAVTPNMEDLLLNAVALAFVIYVDSMSCGLTVPGRVTLLASYIL